MIPADPCAFYDQFGPLHETHLIYSISEGEMSWPVQFKNGAGEVVVEITGGRVLNEQDGACPNEPCSGVIELDFNFLVDYKFVAYTYKRLLNGQETFNDPSLAPVIESPNGDPVKIQFPMRDAACGAITMHAFELFDQDNNPVPAGPQLKNRFSINLGCAGC